jgi:hypothetical protein
MAPIRGHFLWERPSTHRLESVGLPGGSDSRVARRSPRVKLPGYFHSTTKTNHEIILAVMAPSQQGRHPCCNRCASMMRPSGKAPVKHQKRLTPIQVVTGSAMFGTAALILFIYGPWNGTASTNAVPEKTTAESAKEAGAKVTPTVPESPFPDKPSNKRIPPAELLGSDSTTPFLSTETTVSPPIDQ